MIEALEDAYYKDMYILLDLRSDRFKDLMWEVNHGVSGCRVSDIFLKGQVYPLNGIVINTTGE